MGIKTKIKSWIHKIILMTKEEKIQPIIVPVYEKELLKDKVALITGGTKGIGLEIAKAFVNSGAKVIIAGRDIEYINSVINNEFNKDSAAGIVIDVKNVNGFSDIVKNAANLFEEKRIDILVNSAGVVAKNDFWNITEAEYDNIMDTNAKGTFFMSKAVGEFMIANKIKGHILNVTSSSALRPAWTPYQMSKWAVRGFTLGLADVFLPHGIVVNAIAPGPTMTDMLNKKKGDSLYDHSNPSGRYAMPEEIASLAVLMVSGAGDMIVGDTFYMTGGSGTITMHR